MKTRSFVFGALLVSPLLCTLSAHAQEQAPAISYSTELSVSTTGDFAMEHEGSDLGDLSVTTAGIEATASFGSPAQVSHTFGLGYEGIFLDLENDALLPLPDQLNSFSLKYSALYSLDQEWMLTGGVFGMWNGSGTSFDSDGFGVGVWLGAIYSVNDQLSVFFGGAYNSLEEHHFMPGAGIRWTINEAWELSLGYPETALTYHLNEVTSFALVLDGKMETYYVQAEDLNTAANLMGDTKLEYEDIRVGLKVEHEFTEQVAAFAKVGYLIEAKADYFDRNVEFESDDGAVYGELGLKMSF